VQVQFRAKVAAALSKLIAAYIRRDSNRA